MRLGYYDMPTSYIKFLVDSLTGFDVNAALVDTLTVIVFLVALFAPVVTNLNA